MSTVAFIGFGELGSTLARALRAPGGLSVRAWSRPPRDEAADEALDARLRGAGADRAGSIEEAVAGAAAVLAVAPGVASEELARRSAPHLDAQAIYADLTTATPSVKVAAGDRVAARGALYADIAVLGTVAASGAAVPLLGSGPGAEAFRALVEPAGLRVTALEAPAGHATLVKLLRSVYMKGRDALVLEMMIAARKHGLERVVAESIAGPGEEVPFPALAERILSALAVHAERRAHELRSAGAVVRATGVEPLVTEAGAERLERLAALGLRGRFGAERPAGGDEVLAALEDLSAGAASG